CVDSARERLLPDLPVYFLPCAIDNRRPLQALLGYRAMLRAAQPDLLVTYNWGAIDWAMANRLLPICPHLHQEDGFGIEEAAGQLKRRGFFSPPPPPPGPAGGRAPPTPPGVAPHTPGARPRQDHHLPPRPPSCAPSAR